jgi:hypothetical protein
VERVDVVLKRKGRALSMREEEVDLSSLRYGVALARSVVVVELTHCDMSRGRLRMKGRG